VRRITATFAPDGAAWLERLPATIARYAARWGLTVGPAFAGLSYNYVAPATRADGAPAVLKLGVPRAALELYGGAGACRLLAGDAAGGALLLERLKPGTDLTAIADEATAIQIAAQVMRQIHHAPPAGHQFPHVAGWLAGLARLRPYFGGSAGPFPEALVARAEALSAALLASSAPEVVLHGDLHHFNVLQSARGWLAIDPKGAIGEPAYEAGALLRNPLPAILTLPNRRAVLARRSALLAAALELDVTRIRQWAAVQAVLSAWWDVEDGAPEAAQPAIALAADLMSLI
jgi:streptomycin 6-kinase